MNKYYICKKGVYHYLHMAKRNNHEFIQEKEDVKLKKYFYVLRAVLAAKWIIDKHDNPPVLFEELVDSQLDDSLKQTVKQLLEQKINNPEIKTIKRIDTLNNYINEQIEYIVGIVDTLHEPRQQWAELDNYFLGVLDNFK